MSTAKSRKRITAPQLQARKGGEPIVSLTAYSAPVARVLDPHIDVFIVGDSVGIVAGRQFVPIDRADRPPVAGRE